MPKAYWTGSAPTSQPEKSGMDIQTGWQKQPMLATLSITSLSVFNPKAKRAEAATVLVCVDIRNLVTSESHHKVSVIIPVIYLELFHVVKGANDGQRFYYFSLPFLFAPCLSFLSNFCLIVFVF